MRRAIVHIGLPRTGTTSLQRVLSRLRPDLLQRGILYPELTPASADGPHLSHQHLGEALDGRRPRAERAELLGMLRAQLDVNAADVVLLSYESLCLIPRRRAAPDLLRALFKTHGYAMETVLTVKPQAEYLNSTYTWRMQFLRESRTFDQFLRAEMRSARLDLCALSRQWQAACDGRLHAVPVRDRRSDQPLVARFFSALGLLDLIAPLLTHDDTALRENRSPGPVTIEICRRLRRAGVANAVGARARDLTRFVEQQVRDAGLDPAPFRGLDATSRAGVAAHWVASNDRFARAAWSEPWSARALEEPTSSINEIARQETDSEAERLIQECSAAACQRFGIELRSGAYTAQNAKARNLVGDVLAYGRAYLPFR